MFTERELWQIVGLVSDVDYYHESNFKLGLKILDMLPESENKTFYQRIFNQEIIDLEEHERLSEYENELYIAKHYMK